MSLDALGVIAEVAIGLAGFSGVLIVLSRPGGGFSPPERFRIWVLVFSSMGAILFALLPFAVLDIGGLQASSWQIVGGLFALYSGFGIVVLPRQSIRLHQDHPELFPWPLVVVQIAIHVATLGFLLAVVLDLTSHPSGFYVAALITLLALGGIAFVRLLFYRGD